MFSTVLLKVGSYILCCQDKDKKHTCFGGGRWRWGECRVIEVWRCRRSRCRLKTAVWVSHSKHRLAVAIVKDRIVNWNYCTDHSFSKFTLQQIGITLLVNNALSCKKKTQINHMTPKIQMAKAKKCWALLIGSCATTLNSPRLYLIQRLGRDDVSIWENHRNWLDFHPIF